MINLQLVCAALFGAALAAIGVVAGAAADRIRNGRRARREGLGVQGQAPRDTRRAAKPMPFNEVVPMPGLIPRQPAHAPPSDKTNEMMAIVIAALVEAGWPKPVAREAAEAVPAASRANAESWTLAALHIASKGAR